jgi:hypothetical protein
MYVQKDKDMRSHARVKKQGPKKEDTLNNYRDHHTVRLGSGLNKSTQISLACDSRYRLQRLHMQKPSTKKGLTAI